MTKISDKHLYQALKDYGLIEDKLLESAYKKSQKQKISLAKVLTHQEAIRDEDLGRVLADLYKLKLIRLGSISIEDDILKIIPEIVARKQNIISFQKDAAGLHIATPNPQENQTFDFLAKKTGLKIILHYATYKDVQDALSLYTKDVKSAFGELLSSYISKAKGASAEDAPIIEVVDNLLSYAYQNKASDIHIEPLDEKSLIRFRIDGVLHDVVDLPLELHEQIVTRVKVMANLRTDEHMAAQDGKLQQKVKDDDLDVRVSIVPITEGEKVVMRLLSERSRRFSLEDLGLSSSSLVRLKAAYAKPHGMILATGPTGSGKTTTLYAVLKIINKRDVNIMTIEDPVEYDMEGVNQIQVNVKTKLTFAKGLRSIVRQDPDIILVGEIRDVETAGIAVNSAMTGHLVLSTLHTNDAATAFPRILDMKVEPYLVASTVNIVIAQRLVRKICMKCKVSAEYDISKIQLEPETINRHFAGKKKLRAYHGKGCPVCHNTGYTGRIGVYEALAVDDEIRKAIIDRLDASEIKKLAIKNGMRTMIDDGIDKIKQGLTTLDEVLRVTKE